MIHTVDITVPAGLKALPAVAKKLAPEVLTMVFAGIQGRAQRELRTSSSDYTKALSKKDYPVTTIALKRGLVKTGEIVLTGWLPNKVEHGFAGGNMVPYLTQGRTSRVSKDGKRYATVKFIHAGADTTGRSKGAMGEADRKHRGLSRIEAELLGKRIHKVAQKLSATTSTPSGGSAWGQRLNSATTYMLGARKLKANHTVDPYAGMVREHKTYAKGSGNQYATFRRVSESSASKGKWIHPGIPAHHFFDKEIKKIPKYVRKLSLNMVRGAMIGHGGKG